MNDQPTPDGLRPADDATAAEMPSWQSLLAAVDVRAELREAAISAALADYDRMIAESDGQRRAVVIDLAARRRRQLRLLGAAAAVLVIGGAATAGIASRVGNDAPLADTPPMATARMDTAPALADETLMAPAAGAPAVTIESIDGPASAAATDQGEAAAEVGSSAPLALADPPPPQIDSPAALAAYAASIAPGTGIGAVAGSPCAPERTEVLGLVVYQGSRAVVGRDMSGTVVALDAATCVLLASVAP